MQNDFNELTLDELRKLWAVEWGKAPHGTMGRTMIMESLKFKRREKEIGGLSPEQQTRLEELVRVYKSNPENFDKALLLKPGTQLMRKWKGKTHYVTVTQGGFNYKDNIYASLSQIANTITGSRWNGWVFFGLK